MATMNRTLVLCKANTKDPGRRGPTQIEANHAAAPPYNSTAQLMMHNLEH